MGHVMLANVLHRLEEDELAEIHHLRAIALDPEYASHYFNYANTLYELGREEEALVQYQKAYTLDNTLDAAKEMITTLSE
jgi:tetratricopeptide (TPR) repeat protein